MRCWPPRNPNSVADKHLNFDNEFSRFGAEDTLFVDKVHLDASGEERIAEAYQAAVRSLLCAGFRGREADTMRTFGDDDAKHHRTAAQPIAGGGRGARVARSPRATSSEQADHFREAARAAVESELPERSPFLYTMQ